MPVLTGRLGPVDVGGAHAIAIFECGWNRVGWRALAQHRLRRVAGNQMDQREDQRGDAKQNGNREHESARQKGQHACIVAQPFAIAAASLAIQST